MRHALEPRGDVHAVAHEVTVLLLHDVAQMDADAKFDPAIVWHDRCAGLSTVRACDLRRQHQPAEANDIGRQDRRKLSSFAH